jgi:hypothetical protein
MSINVNCFARQVSAVILPALFIALGSCGRNKTEAAIIPPPTAPLSREVIGFGVINVSYIHVTGAPENGGSSPGYLRRGSVVQVIERRVVTNGVLSESWVLVDGSHRGWVKENLVDIYDNEGRARTAAESMNR